MTADPKAIVPAFPPWMPTRIRRRRLRALLDATGDIWQCGALRDAIATECRRISLRLLFVPQDFWVGLYWKHTIEGWDGGWGESWAVYLTLIPTLPLRLTVDRSNRNTRAYRRYRESPGQ